MVKCIEDEIPFELPAGWVWSRLEPIASLITDYVANGSFASLKANVRTYKEKNYALFVRTVDFANNFKGDLSYIDKESYDFLEKSKLFGGELMLSNIGASIGKVFKVPHFDIPMSLAPNAIILRFFNDTTCDYFEYVFKSFVGQEYLQFLSGGAAMPKFNKTDLRAMIVPVPPMNEQTKIVEAVRSTFTFIDDLDVSYNGLTATIQSVKSKILDLAIRGKLVPQNPEDEPASVLLDRIRAEKEELIKQGKIKRDKKESVIFKGEDNSYYVRAGEQVEDISAWELDNLPSTWGICALGEICDYGSCTNVETDQISDDEWILDLEDIEKDSGKVLCKVRKIERNAVSTKHKFSEGQVLYSKLRPYLNKVVLADEDGYCTSEILPLVFSDIIVPAYARYYLMSSTFLKYADRCSYGVKMPRLSTTDGKKAVFTLPPINEQYRIVEAIENAFTQLDSIAESLN